MGRRLSGSVRPYKGRWRAYVGREYLGVFDTEQEAWDTVNAWLALEGKRGKAPDLLRVFAAEWFDQRELDGHVRGVEAERSVWRARCANAEFIDWPMKRIKPRHIQAHLRKLLKQRSQYVHQTKGEPTRHRRDKPLSRQSVVHARRLLVAVFEDAVVAGKIPSNPARGVRMPKREDDAKQGELVVFAKAAEVERLFALPLSAFERAVFSLAVYSGLRMGEIWGLCWEHMVLDGEQPLVKVRKSYDGPPKTRHAVRDVPLLPPVIAALTAWKRRDGLARIAGLVFPKDGGGPHSRGYDAGWSDHRERKGGKLVVRKGLRSAAGIGEQVTFHCLRHTCACHLLQGNWVPKLHPRALSLLELKHWLGHSSIVVTEQRYAVLAPGNLHDAVKAQKPGDPDPNKKSQNEN